MMLVIFLFCDVFSCLITFVIRLSFALPCPRKGKEFVDQWMATHCLLVDCSENMTSAVQSFLKFKEQFRQATDQ